MESGKKKGVVWSTDMKDHGGVNKDNGEWDEIGWECKTSLSRKLHKDKAIAPLFKYSAFVEINI